MIINWESNNIYFKLSYPKREWSKFINQENKNLCPEEALDLLSKMLVYDHVRINFILGFKNNSKRGFRASLFFTCKRVKKMIIKFFWKLKKKKIIYLFL